MTEHPAVSDLFSAAMRAYHQGNRTEAEHLCRTLFQREPLHAGAANLFGALALDAGDLATAIQYFHLATTVEPEAAAYHHALGEAYRMRGELRTAVECYRRALARDETLATSHNSLGLALLDLGDGETATPHVRRAVALQPGTARFHNNLGRALQANGDLSGAKAAFAEAVRLQPDYAIALNNLGVALQGLNRLDAAIETLNRALRARPDYPEAHFNLGNTFLLTGDNVAAARCFGEAVRLRPEYPKAHHGLGRALVPLNKPEAALDHFTQAVRLQPDFVEALQSLGELLMLKPDWDAARAVLDRALDLKPDDPDLLARQVWTRQMTCDWAGLDADFDRLWTLAEKQISADEPVAVNAFQVLTLPWSPERHLAVVRAHSRRIAESAKPVRETLNFSYSPSPDGRIRLGYLSGEFYDHAVCHQAQGIFALHDRKRFRVTAYSYGKNDGSAYRQKVIDGCDAFVDITALTAADAARRINADGIDLLIDLSGYTGHSRSGIAALRPAPIQIGFLGFSTSSGADFFDYFIGDGVTVPDELLGNFSETVIRLPDTYMPTDRQPIGPPPTRAAYGLPDGAFVLCSLNNSYKITPDLFSVWMRLLARVPNAVLWLFFTSPAVEKNLRREAAARGIAPERLIFAGHVPDKADHLARIQLADLFLDTFVYNAHSTACDALWAGVPLITRPGRAFANRVAASLLTAVGLPDLIADSLEAYEALTLRLAENPTELAALRRRLEAARTTTALFDTPRYVANLERALWEIWKERTKR